MSKFMRNYTLKRIYKRLVYLTPVCPSRTERLDLTNVAILGHTFGERDRPIQGRYYVRYGNILCRSRDRVTPAITSLRLEQSGPH